MKLDYEYIRDMIVEFREIMCSRRYTIEQKEESFTALMRCWLLCEKDAEIRLQTIMDATVLEFERRRIYECIGI